MTHAEVVNRTGGHEEIEVRYYWVDERIESDNFANTCTGFATRSFTVDDGQVTGMSGEQRS